MILPVTQQVSRLSPSTRSQIPPFYVMQLFAEAQELASRGTRLLHLSLGQPSAPTPAPLIAEAHRLLDSHPLGYTDGAGLLPLRQRIARFYGERYGIDLPWQRIFVTTGSSAALCAALLSACDTGARVAMSVPGYPAYPNMTRAFSMQPVLLETTASQGYLPDTDLLTALPSPPDALIVCSPSNPTGSIVDAARMQRLAAYCAEHATTLISDEIYHGICHTEIEPVTALNYAPEALVINSFSKYFLLPGWRLGWLVAPEGLCDAVNAVLQHLYVSPPTLAQHLALAAFDQLPLLDAEVTRYAKNRAMILPALERMGFTELSPADGAFYVYANCSAFTDDSTRWCRQLMRETGVVATPGVDFDPKRGHHTIRFSYSGSTEMVQAALDAMEAYILKTQGKAA